MARTQRRQFSREILDQAPPHDVPAEVGVIGSVLLDPAKLDVVSQIVRSTDFHGQRNRTLFDHLTAMRNGGDGVIDVLLLKSRLRRAGQWNGNGESAAYLTEVMESVPYAANAIYYARIVREKARLRTIINVALDTVRRAYDPTVDYDELVEGLRGLVREMGQDQ